MKVRGKARGKAEKKSLYSQFKIKKTGDSSILYDADSIAEPALVLFDADYHTNQHARQNISSAHKSSPHNSPQQTQSGIGRARVVYFSLAGKSLVLKHYYRGGAAAFFLKDRYLGFAVENSRSFREWRLLKKMRQLGLPVPEAVAAHVNSGLLFYRADLITEEIKNAKTLAELLQQQPLTTEIWINIGSCIKRFHDHGIYHADLNARNILLVDAVEVYLIDFDNSGFRTDSSGWKLANLARLKRSLSKFKKNEKCFYFDENSWTALLQGYHSQPASD